VIGRTPLSAFVCLALLAGYDGAGAESNRQAGAGGCAAQCRDQHNRCRIATKGSPSCDAQLQACLQGCLSRRS